jgi:6-pyruvoyltetrahydropterin/6-carboxytetrahydropterin synthase
MLTCTKRYHDIPFAHRQHHHEGHCSLIHGHNWSFVFIFGCRETDPNGFVVDFGKLKFIKRWLSETFDHACVFNRSDPLREALVSTVPEAWKAVVVPDCSCEGLARFAFDQVDPMVREATGGRAFVSEVVVFEDTRNSAAYKPDRDG